MAEDMQLNCEKCLCKLTDEEQARFYRAYDRLDYPENVLLPIYCNRCRAKGRAVQVRMHAVMEQYARERGR